MTVTPPQTCTYVWESGALCDQPAEYWWQPDPGGERYPRCSKHASWHRIRLVKAGDGAWKAKIYRMDGSDQRCEPPRRRPLPKRKRT